MGERKESVEHAESRCRKVYYDSAAKYWSQIPATIEGMLGGFGFISRTDIKGSQGFLKHLFMMKDPPGKDRAADCGAGIGRVTKNLLTKYFKNVDLVEQNPKFLEEAKSFIRAKKTNINCCNVGLQDFSPELETYDVIWSQWVLGHLTDEDLVTFFKACKSGLKPNGVIVVKENITSSGDVEVDYEDSSVTRPLPLFKDLYKQAGLKCIYEQKQTNFPKGIYQVIMFALVPDQQASNKLHTLVTSEDIMSVVSNGANYTPTNASNESKEDIKPIHTTDQYAEFQENDINRNSISSVIVNGGQMCCSAASKEEIETNSTMFHEEDSKAEKATAKHSATEDSIMSNIDKSYVPENMEEKHHLCENVEMDCLPSEEANPECQMSMQDDTLFKDCSVEQVANREVGYTDTPYLIISQPIDIQLECEGEAIEDLPLEANRPSRNSLGTVNMPEVSKDIHLLAMKDECQAFQSEEMLQDDKEPSNMQQECQTLPMDDIAPNCVIIAADVVSK